MYFSPFIKLWVIVDGTEVDISDVVSKLTYKRDVEKENELTFSVEQKYIERLAEDNNVRRGVTLQFQYGFKGGEKSVVHKARVVEVAYTYTTKVSMNVTARDLGTVMKKNYSDKVWTGVTTSDICKQLAVQYGLEFKGDDTDYVWNNYPQSQKDDWAFLMEIVERDEGGNYMIYVDDGFIILERRGLDKPSDLSFQYGDGTRVISFAVSEQEKKASSAGMAGTKLTGFDPNKKEKIEANATDGNLDQNIDTGPYDYKYSANGELLSGPESNFNVLESAERFVTQFQPGASNFDVLGSTTAFTTQFGTNRVTNIKDEKELKNAANSGTKGGKLKVIKGTLKINGVPGLKLNSIVTIRGVYEIHNGNYLVKIITDEVSSSGFITTMEMERNASLKPNKKTEIAGVDLTKINTSVGADALETKKEVFVFNANGERIQEPKTQYKTKQ